MSIKVCIIGCGNISNTRHIPAVEKLNDVRIAGLISDQKDKMERTMKRHKKLRNISNAIVNAKSDYYTELCKLEWFVNAIDAVIIGTPPMQHYPVVKACLRMRKHVLVEKPMMLNADECSECTELAKTNNLVLNVMHSFQFSNGMIELKRRFDNDEFGSLKSILELQLTNRDRRLPVWYNELPLGLFFDEAAHFFYSANKFGGHLAVKDAHAVFNENDNTPRFLQAQMMAGDIPVQMYMNFNSPICEWGILLLCEKKIAIYDYFKDILIVLKNDGQHLAKNVLENSLSFFLQFWRGFIKNGFLMVTGNLLYGHDECIKEFAKATKTGQSLYELSPELGLEVTGAMNEVVKLAKKYL